MKKQYIVLPLIFILSAVAGIAAGFFTVPKEKTQISNINTENVKTESTPSPTPTFQIEKQVAVTEKYLVTLSDTMLIIYKINSDGSMQLVEEKPINTFAIPETDIEALYKGVTFETLTEARELLEDFTE